jgi:DNA-binding MarR family transcriptional regulator
VERRRDLEGRVVDDFRELISESYRMRGRFAEQNRLPSNQFRALQRIARAEREEAPLTARDLREQMGLSAGGVTYLIDRMAEAGLVRREAHPTDLRKVVLRGTDDGLALAGRLRARLAAHSHHAFADLDNDELNAAHRALVALAAALRAYQTDPPMPSTIAATTAPR